MAISTLLVPYPQYGALTQTNTPGFMSHTYSAELRLRRSFRNGLGFTLSYANPVTRTTAFFNTEDQYLNHPTFQDTALPEHSLNASGTWNAVGKGRRYRAACGSRWIFSMGGWIFSPIVTFNSGTPIQFGALSVLKPGSPQLSNQTLADGSRILLRQQAAYTIRSTPYYTA